MKKLSLLFLSLILILLNVEQSYSQYIGAYAGNFNGTTSYVDIPDSPELNPTNAITIEAWVNPKVNSGCNCIVGKNWNSSYWFGLNCGGGKLRFYPKGGANSRVDGIGVIPINKWTHVAATYDGTTTKLYINGQLDNSVNLASGPLVSNTDPLYIGCDRDATTKQYFWNGYLDNVRIWKEVRTENQIKENMYVPLQYKGNQGVFGGLVAAYLLDWNADDRSGAVNNNGTLQNVGMIDLSKNPQNHVDYNNSLYLDGNSHCSLVNHVDYNATTAITVEAWIRRDLTPPAITNQTIISKGSSQGGGRTDFHLKLMGTTLAFDIGSAGTVEFANAITDDKWYHIAGTYNSADGVSKLYIDGKKVGEITTASKPAISNNPDSLFIGRAGTGGADLAARFKGWIDEVRIWKNVAKTEEEIKSTIFSSRSYTDGASQSCTFAFDQFTNSLYTNASGYTNAPLFFWGNAKIGSAKTQNIHTAPLIFPYPGYSQNNFILSNKKVVITAGTTITDSVLVPGTSLSVDNLVALVLLNHGAVGGLTLTLSGPGGFSTNLTPVANTSYTSNDLIAILVQGGIDSTIAYKNPQLAPFSPAVKPAGNLWDATGTKANGWWKLRVTDASTGEMLRVINSWGIWVETSTKVEYTVSVSSSNVNYGTASGGGTFFAGSQVTVSAAPKIGYNFVNWTEGGTEVSKNMNYTFTLNANRTLIANFAVSPSLGVTPDFVTVPSTAGTGSFSVANTTGGTMNWTAASNVNWLSITSGASGINSGTINFSYQANTGAARIGKITVTSTGTLGSPKSVEVRQATGVGIDDLNLGIPETYVLAQNYPNPFNPVTTIRYGLPASGHVKISVYDVIGNELATLVDKQQNAGYHEIMFDASGEGNSLSTGVYFYKIVSDNFMQVRKMVVMK